MFKFIYPKVNELTVFIISVTLYSAILYIPEISIEVVDLFQLLLDDWLEEFALVSGFIDSSWFVIKSTLKSTFFTLLLLGAILLPLFLPFTNKDIRRACFSVILLDLGLLITFNVVNIEQYPIIRQLLIAYYVIWFLYAIILGRINQNINHLMNMEQTKPSLALVLAFISSVLTATLYLLFDWWWIDAYLTSVYFVLISERLYKNKFSTRILDVS